MKQQLAEKQQLHVTLPLAASEEDCHTWRLLAYGMGCELSLGRHALPYAAASVGGKVLHIPYSSGMNGGFTAASCPEIPLPLWTDRSVVCQKEGDALTLNTDIISPVVDLLTLGEERRITHRDVYGLFEGARSARFQNQALLIPFFDNLVVALRRLLALPPPATGHPFTVVVTCDVDYLHDDHLGGVLDFFQDFGVECPTFYIFAGSDRKKTQYDPHYDITDPAIVRRLQPLREARVEIGLHGGFLAHDDIELLREQKDRLEQWLGKSVIGHRAHYFRFAYPRSWIWQHKAGFTYDAGLGYADYPGFRNGSGRPLVFPLPHAAEKPFFVLPNTVLDQHFFWPSRLPDKEREAIIDTLLDNARKAGAALVLDWHSYTLNSPEYPGWWEPLKSFLTRARERGAFICGAGTLVAQETAQEELVQKQAEYSFYEQAAIWDQTTERYQIEVLNDILAVLPEDARSILDAGCGDGFITNNLPGERRVTGLDISAEALSRVTREARQGSLLALPFDDASFDLVMCNDVLEHLTDDERKTALGELFRVASKYVLITTPLREDMNMGMVRCAQCGGHYHVNHHKKSFSLEDHAAFAPDADWHCQLRLLTGDMQHRPSADLTLFKSIFIGNDFSALRHARCTHCGSSRHAPPIEDSLNIWTRFLARQAHEKNCFAGFHGLRTECLSLFSRQNPSKLKAGFYDTTWRDAPVSATWHQENRILFAEEKLFRNHSLQTFFTRPQYCNSAQPEGLGGHIEPGQELLFSFFCQEKPEGRTLYLAGTAETSGDMELCFYNDDTYSTIARFQTNAGAFSLSLELPPIALSAYGHLLRLTATAPLHMTEATLSVGVERTYEVYATGQARFWRLRDDEPLALSLPIYEGLVPRERWMEYPDISCASSWRSVVLSDAEPSPSAHQCMQNMFDFFYGELQRQARLHVRAESSGQLWRQALETRQTHQQHHQLTTQQQQQAQLDELRAEITRIHRLVPVRFFQRLKKALAKLLLFFHFAPEKERILQQANSPCLDTMWQERTRGKRSFLMLCHDQSIDRRIIQEAHSLQNDGWEGILVAISHTDNDVLDTVDGLKVHRIGLSRIVPDCPAFWLHKRLELLCGLLPFSGLFHRANWLFYKVARVVYYRSLRGGNPLPFDNAYYGAGRHYRADMVQAHDLPALKTAVTLAEQWGVPAVYDAHEFYPEQAVFSLRQKQLMFAVEQEHITKCRTVFAVNQSIGRAMAEKYGIPEPHELTNAVNPPSMPLGGNLLRRHFGLEDDRPIALLQGGIVGKRNLEPLVEAMARVKHQRAVLVFMGDGSLVESLKKQARRLGVQNRILFKEAVPQAELIAWSSSADVGIIPYPAIDLNTTCCTPNKLFEYIQAGLPILANDLPELRRFVRDTDFGLTVPMQSADAVASALDEILDQPELLRSMRQTLADKKALYAWDVQGEKFLTIIKQVLGESYA